MHSGNQRREHARKMVKAAGYATGGMVGLSGAKKDEPFKYKRLDGGHDGYRSGGRIPARADGGLSGKTSEEEHHGHSRAMHEPSKLRRGGHVHDDEAEDKKLIHKELKKEEKAEHRMDGGGIGQEGGPNRNRPGGKGNHYEWHHDGKHMPPHMKEVAGGFKDGGKLPGMPKSSSVHDLGYAKGGLHKRHKPRLPSMAGPPMSVPPMGPAVDTPPMPPNPMAGGAPPGMPPDGSMGNPGQPPMNRGGAMKKGHHRKRH